MPEEASPVQGAAANGSLEKPEVHSSPHHLKRKAEVQRGFNEGSADANGNKGCSGCGLAGGKGYAPYGDIIYNTKHARFQEPWLEPCSKEGTIKGGIETISKQLTKGQTYIEGEHDAVEPQDEDEYTSEGEEQDEEDQDNEREVDEGHYDEEDDDDEYARVDDEDNDDEDDNEPATKRRK